MGGQFYDNALQTQHDVAGVDLTGVATVATYGGPAGRRGRILDATIDITTAITVSDAEIDIGESGGDVDAQLDGWTLAFTGSGIGDRLAPTRDNSTVSLEEGVDIEPDVDTIVQVAVAATAGAGDLRLLVAWW
jgi:hypothetical protein